MSNLIIRQAAIDAIERKAYRHTYFDQIVDIIKALPSAETEPNSWTPCSKKKHPDRTTDCYVTIRDEYYDFVDEDTWWEESECWDKYSEDEIIAWMPNVELEPYNSLSMLHAENRGEK